jgi:four helix bundle protein
MRNFRKLEVWQRSIRLSKSIYLLTGSFPAKERFGMSSQLQRAAVSVASNIAEGASRRSPLDFARFLRMSLGSAFEVETQLHIAKEVGYLTPEELEVELEELTILQKQINQLITKILSRINRYPICRPGNG